LIATTVRVGVAGESHEENLKSLCATVGMEATDAERDAYVQRIVDRVDRLLEPILRTHRSEAEIVAGIKATFGGEEENRYDSLITLKSVPESDDIVVVYEVPRTSAWNLVRMVLRVWIPPDASGKGGVLRHLEDRGRLLADILYFRVKELGFLKHDGDQYLVMVGHDGNGQGSDGLSLWSLKDGVCLWALQPEYGDRTCNRVVGEDLFVRIAHNDFKDLGAHAYVTEEHFGWTQTAFVDLYTRGDDQPPICELPR